MRTPAWLDPPPPCLGAQLVQEPGLLPLLSPQRGHTSQLPWGPLEGSGANCSEGHARPGNKGDWKYNPISIYFYTEIETGEKKLAELLFATTGLLQGVMLLVRTAAGASLTSPDFLPFLDYLMTGLLCEVSHLTLLPCQASCNSISQRRTTRWGSKAVGHLFGNLSDMLPDLSPI